MEVEGLKIAVHLKQHTHTQTTALYCCQGVLRNREINR
jgi:hypothetical protein